MKLVYKPAPNYRSPQSTSGIMRDLTLCLCAITIFSVLYYSMTLGASAGLRVVIMMAVSVICALATEAVWYKCTKQDVLTGIKTSYGWVTGMILTLMSSINVSVYALGVATVIAILFGKMVFGGFGQNIFNPAAFGEAILMNTFAGSNTDVLTGATPAAAMKAYGWMASNEAFGTFLADKGFGSLGQMFLGWYPSVIGNTSALLILLCFAFLIWRKDIDWQTTVFYICGVFVITLVIGLMRGRGLWYPLFHVLAGGVIFGGVFMMTDPVTSPVTIAGRVIFAIGAAVLTVIFRLRSNMPDGVLYSILLMNMMTPAIDKIMEGSQIKDFTKIRNKVLIIGGCLSLVALGVGAIAEEKVPAAAPASADAGDDQYKVEVEELSNDGSTAVYHVSADGFGLIDPDGIASSSGHEYSRNELEITVDLATQSVAKVVLKNFGDTEGIGDTATSKRALNAFKGATLDTELSTVTSATWTSSSVNAMVKAALNAAAGN